MGIFFLSTNQESLFTDATLSFLVHKAEINVLKWYNASANTTERQRKTPSWSEESAVLIWNTHGLDPLGFYLDA